ncbi:threonine synthase [Helicobacter sp. 10-6591]|uniref:threonine synthase n=1 Tax=Helicobacter sp. 10-6591 TaxID=2004998 RepID=UPI000DCB129B|nr:threonine synthase [Helicobacter sp. 10-6591]MCI7484940.1 threonine synthase [Helicobacter sp.]RAX56132.1 threonine synthase [Helicobacter sp. 10-6591]
MNTMLQTRGEGDQENRSFQEALLEPNASFGGLYAFCDVKPLALKELEQLSKLSYKQLCKKVFGILGLDLREDILELALESYEGFDCVSKDNDAPLVLYKYNPNLFILELFHGPTRAFKDMALQPFGAIISALAREQKRRFLVLAATSGDTGPATLEAFKDNEYVQVVCLYPKDGTSDVQRLQMVTQDSQNLRVIGIEGDFDMAQTALKNLLSDREFKDILHAQSITLSAANSVNIGRIAFQVIYHIWAYLELVRNGAITLGEKVYNIVPSGNFGNILGALYAYKLGIPFSKLISASNPNKILYDFLTTGVYDIRSRALIKSNAPAMDILKSSNVERVLFEFFGSQRTKQCMQELENNGIYKLIQTESEQLRKVFAASFCDDVQCEAQIAQAFKNGYLLDPHTACGMNAYREFTTQERKFLLCSTAEWSKFAPIVDRALHGGTQRDYKLLADRDAIKSIQKSAGNLESVQLNSKIAELFSKPIVHNYVLNVNELKNSILSWIQS